MNPDNVKEYVQVKKEEFRISLRRKKLQKLFNVKRQKRSEPVKEQSEKLKFFREKMTP